MAVSKQAQKVVGQLKTESGEEEPLQAAIDNYSKIVQKGDEKKTQKAKQDLEKVVKKMKKVKMQDVEKLMEKEKIVPKQKK